ncbi:MAG: hypothetical protein PHS45_02790 [Bacilli bacterium]|nr:hypothetical protein [Bacilli bacterium]
MFNRFKYLLWALVFIFLFMPMDVNASDTINIHYFWGEGCSACANMTMQIDKLIDEYPEIKVYKYEIYKNKKNLELLSKVEQLLKVEAEYIPFIVIGNKTITGARGYELESYINYYLENPYKDLVGETLGIVKYDEDIKLDDNYKADLEKITIPFIGSFKVSDLSLPLATIIFGLIDGFNPCALSVLLFLISMLIGMNDRKRMWILGTTFILASALVYFLCMTAILKVMLVVGARIWFRLVLALVALIGGIVNIRGYFNTKDIGCKVTNEKQRNRNFSKIKKFINERSLLIAMFGITLVAFTVNLFELACSAGLPLAYIKVLELNKVSNIGYYGYILLYLFFYMLDHIIIFGIAMATLKVTGVSSKYVKYSKLLGGILMLIIGVLLALKPELLMFS